MCDTFSTQHTSQILKLYLPQEINLVSFVLEYVTAKAVSFAAGDPQIASPVSTFQTMMLLSSSPPSVVKYLQLCENDSP